MKRIMTMLTVLFMSIAAIAQETPAQLVTWTPVVEKADGDLYQVVFTGKVAPGYHTYTLTDEFSATTFMDTEITGGELVGNPYELGQPKTDAEGSKYYGRIKQT